MPRNSFSHTYIALRLFASHYRQAPLQATAILIGVVLAVTLFVAVQAINLNAKRSYSESTESLSVKAQTLVIPLPGQRYLSQSVYFSLRQAGVSHALPIIEGRVVDSQGRRWQVQGSELISAITSRMKYSEQQADITLSSEELPLAELMAGEPIAMLSRDKHIELGEVSSLILDGISTKVVALPDEWQLGNRMLLDIGFAQKLLNKEEKLSYIAVFSAVTNDVSRWQSLVDSKAQWVENTRSTDLGSLTDSFHLNLTAMSLLAFLVGLFIAYNGVKYSLLKRSRLLIQMQQAGMAPIVVFWGLLIELVALVCIGSFVGFVIGIQLSHWLHPTVALTLEQLYGATLLPGTWKWQWWLQAFVFTLLVALMACWHHFKEQVSQPLSSHSGFYLVQKSSGDSRTLVLAVVLSAVALMGLHFSEYHRWTMFWLGILVVSIPLYIPKTLNTLSQLSLRRTRNGLVQYMFAELQELIAPLSLAMMALLLAVTANIGMNTLVGSFELTLKQWLDQRLHADIYISPAQNAMSDVEKKLEDVDGVEEIYKQYYVEDSVHELPTLLGTKDRSTLEQTMVFKSSSDNFWSRFYAGHEIAISEPTAVKLNLSLGEPLILEQFRSEAFVIGAIFHDYGSPNGEILVAPAVWRDAGFTMTPTSLGLKVEGERSAIYRDLKTTFDLHSSQLYDQAEIKTIALNIFSQTFAVTKALNGVTLLVAVIGLFSACYMLLEARKAAIARLHALGVSRRKLIAMMISQIVMLVIFTLSIALPLGAVVGYVLTDIVTLRAFGWSLTYMWSWGSAFSLSFVTILAALIATLIPLWQLVKKPVVSSLQSEVL